MPKQEQPYQHPKIEPDPEMWARFQESVRKVAKAGPAHREARQVATKAVRSNRSTSTVSESSAGTKK
jgi:hypothetical protein